MIDLANEFLSAQARQRSETLIKAELLALVSDEIQCRQNGLTPSRAQSAAELLKKNCRTLGRPQE